MYEVVQRIERHSVVTSLYLHVLLLTNGEQLQKHSSSTDNAAVGVGDFSLGSVRSFRVADLVHGILYLNFSNTS